MTLAFVTLEIKKICAFERGLESSRNVGSLSLFFDYVRLPMPGKFSADLNVVQYKIAINTIF